MSAPRTLSPSEARRLALACQHLAAPQPPATADGMMDVLRDLRCLQLDPLRVVERTQLLVLWSRLGGYDPALLDRLIYDEMQLFEFWAHCASLVLTEDYPIHHWLMRAYANSKGRTHTWMEQNAALRQQILDRLRSEGPLSSDQFEDESDVGWHSSGWSKSRNVSQMINFLWIRGEVMVARRKGLKKFWQISERCLPPWTPRSELDDAAMTALAAQHSLRALGVATNRHIRNHFVRGNYPGLGPALTELQRGGQIEPVQIVDGGAAWPGTWWIHRDRLPLLEAIQGGEWLPRTTLLSPFDNLICDRARSEQLFNFRYRVEIYVPKAQRQYGYYVLPILHGDRLVGRVDPQMERKQKRLRIHALHWEPEVELTDEIRQAASAALEELAQFLGAKEVVAAQAES